PPGVDELCERQIDRFADELKAALERWCERWRALEEEWRALQAARRPTEEERRARNRLESEMDRMEEAAAPDRRPLGFLGLVGFLPRYGATGERTLLVTPHTDAPIDQAAHVAITDFAPGNLVYARGRRLRVSRVHPRPVEEVEDAADFRDNVIRQGRRCDDCQLFTTDPLQRACPTCGRDLVSQTVIELTGVRGGGGSISSDDEYRTRAAYDVMHALGAAREPDELLHLGGYELRLTRRREITIANRGPLPDEPGTGVAGFAICSECGYAEEDPGLAPDDAANEPEVQEHRGHGPRCPARRDPDHPCVLRGLWLTARLQGDVVEVPLSRGQGDTGFQCWRRTLLEALMLGIRETMQADRRDLDVFEVPCDGVPERLVIFDTMPGGTGYLPKLLADGGAGLREAAAEALARLESCDCEASCHRCLRDFWNQRVHGLLDRRTVIPTLRRLAEAIGTEQLPSEDERLMSFLELEFHRRLEQAGLSMPTLQVIHRLPDGRITVADFAYADPDISIFLDGRAYHAQSEEKIRGDLRKRNELEARGRLVLEFTYADVMERFDDVTEMIRRGLSLAADGAMTNGEVPEGLTVTGRDDAGGRLTVSVEPAEWVADEEARQRGLAAANEARLRGWRLSRAA
ncbi:MAG: Zn-binding domain-containing protein, partial [Thermoleophilaceae bacterium]